MTKSKSPSLSKSPTSRPRAFELLPDTILLNITFSVKEGSAAPSFSYQAIPSYGPCSAPSMIDKISKSPSLSKSKILLSREEDIRSAVLTTDSVQEGSAAPSFLYQLIMWS